jgi:hypothetical protein
LATSPNEINLKPFSIFSSHLGWKDGHSNCPLKPEVERLAIQHQACRDHQQSCENHQQWCRHQLSELTTAINTTETLERALTSEKEARLTLARALAAEQEARRACESQLSHLRLLLSQSAQFPYPHYP